MTRTYRQPTQDELAVLQQFADAHGRRWKDELSNVYWYNARVWSDARVDGRPAGHVLHGIRNDLGPTWLFDVCTIKPAPKPVDHLAAVIDRAAKLYRKHSIRDQRITILMDLEFADRQIPIDFERLAAATDADFAHDVLGIRQHMDRKRCTLTGCFVPRFARPKP